LKHFSFFDEYSYAQTSLPFWNPRSNTAFDVFCPMTEVCAKRKRDMTVLVDIKSYIISPG